MNIFTQNQKDRITAVMNNSPRRTTLKTSTKDSPIPLFANDAEVKLESSCPLSVCGAIPNQTNQKISIYNRGTSNLSSAMLTYNINGGIDKTYNWTGNLAGTSLYSGGPYFDTTPIPALITQNWTLPNNDCYTFTINDVSGDGICCEFGTGFYDIKSLDGAVVVKSGASFSTTESKTFSINIDETVVVVGSDDFYIYPNPTKKLSDL
jgi:hypothetical protein